MKLPITIALLFSATILFSGDFSLFIKDIPYEEVKKNITALEIKEFNKITFKNKRPTYKGPLIRLYFLASGINTPETMKQYMNQYNSLLKYIKSKLRSKKLNKYNKAEYILHLIHSKLFIKVQTGAAAGYNIGIKKTFDEKAYNCYKSALIYNSILSDLGFVTALISVPEHIYSIVYIDGQYIDVETTSRYGFDPYNKGRPNYKRKFDKKNIRFSIRYYSKKTPVNNIPVLITLYHNRVVATTGEAVFYGVNLQKDFKRAAAMALLESYLDQFESTFANESLMHRFYEIMKISIKENPTKLQNEATKYRNFLYSLPQNVKKKNYLRNKDIFIGQHIRSIKNNDLKLISNQNYKQILSIHIKELKLYIALIIDTPEILKINIHNSGISLEKIIFSSIDKTNLNQIKLYHDNMLSYYKNPLFLNKKLIFYKKNLRQHIWFVKNQTAKTLSRININKQIGEQKLIDTLKLSQYVFKDNPSLLFKSMRFVIEKQIDYEQRRINVRNLSDLKRYSTFIKNLFSYDVLQKNKSFKIVQKRAHNNVFINVYNSVIININNQNIMKAKKAYNNGLRIFKSLNYQNKRNLNNYYKLRSNLK